MYHKVIDNFDKCHYLNLEKFEILAIDDDEDLPRCAVTLKEREGGYTEIKHYSLTSEEFVLQLPQ